MATAKAASPEQEILRSRARGEVSADAAFERLYALHHPAVRAFLRLRARAAEAEDLVQDVWMIFHHRWRRWEFRPEMEAAEARPVLSFLYRTCQFVLQGHWRRAARAEEPIADRDAADARQGAERLLRDVEVGRCLGLAREVCTPGELEVLLAKLAGVPAREIARGLGITEAVVDHRFRGSLERLRKRLRPAAKPVRRRGRHA